jgi:hypothetical protein
VWVKPQLSCEENKKIVLELEDMAFPEVKEVRIVGGGCPAMTNLFGLSHLWMVTSQIGYEASVPSLEIG